MYFYAAAVILYVSDNKGVSCTLQLLEERIRKDGIVRGEDILKVDCFLNHQIDTGLLEEMAREWKRLFQNDEITKILTIEASGIALACFAAKEFGCPLLFAKKAQTKNISDNVYSSKVRSFTHDRVYDIFVSKQFLLPEDKILIIDDFLANGAALKGLISLIRDAGAEIVGAGIDIEKAFQPGGEMIRKMGIRVESLARIASMNEKDGITFI